MATIQGVYVALFGRPADPLGLAFFNTATNNGANLSAIGNLAGTAEYQGRFTGQSNVQIINSIYQSLFNRDADVAGLTFFANQLATGRQTINTIAINILDGATGTDKTIVDAKEAAANLYTAALNTGSEIVAYSGTAAASAGRVFLSGVTTTVPTAAAVDTAVATMVSNVGTNPGATSALTTGIDTLTGTAGNDTFQGVEANFGALDRIDGGSGIDNVVLALTSAANTVSASQVSNVEKLTISQTTNAGVVTVGATGITDVVNEGSTVALTVQTLPTLANLEVRNSSAATTVVYAEAAAAGATDAVNVALTNVTGAAAVNVNTATVTATVAGAIEVVNLASNGSSANSITFETNDTQGMTTLNVSGSAALTVALGTNAATDVTTINASASTGGVTVTGIGAGNDVAGTAIGHTITGGTGNDSFALGANYIGAEAATASTRDTINGGTGTDTLSITIARAVAASAAAQTNLTSIEALTISDAWTTGNNIDVTRFADVRTLNLAGATAGTSTATLTAGTTVVLAGDTANDSITSFTVAGTGTTDALTLNMAGFNFAGTGTETFTGVETLNINTGASVTDAAVFADAVTFVPSAGVTSTNVVVTGANAMTFTGVVTGAASIDASALTGILTVTGAPAAGITIRGGTAADVITGSAGNDLIVGGNGADTITMGAGNDSINLTETVSAIDKVVFAAVANSDTAAAGLAKVGTNVITGFGTNDTLNVAGLGDGTTSATNLATFTTAAAQSAFTDDAVHIINVNGTAGALTAGGTATITDFTNTTQVAAFLAERFTLADADQEGVIVWNQTGTTYIYQVSGDGTAGFQAADIALVGTVSQTAALTAANLVYA